MSEGGGLVVSGFPEPSIARIYDYALGGKDNYPVDRNVYEKMTVHYPQYSVAARANRAFLARVVARLAGVHGIRQFLDLGSGIPTSPNVHESARAVHPRARVVYTDTDQTAYVHGRAHLSAIPGLAYLHHDATDIHGLLRHPDVRPLIAPHQGLGVLAIALWHFLPDHQIHAMLDDLRAVVAPGSLLAFSIAAATDAQLDPDERTQAGHDIRAWAGYDFYLRTPAEVHGLLEGLDLEPPGLVDLRHWPVPEPEPARELYWRAGLARLA